MDITLSFRHIEASPSLESRIKEKLNRLTKILNENVSINWITSVEKSKSESEKLLHQTHKSEVGIQVGKTYIRASARDNDIYKTIDEVIKKLRVQLQKRKRSFKRRK